MTAKELKKLKRSELLEILLARTAEVERLQKELDEANKKLEDRAILLDNVGSIAEASLKLNGVFEAAEAAAEQYLKNIERITCGGNEIAEPEEAEKPKAAKKTPKKESKSKNASAVSDVKDADEAVLKEKTEEDSEDAK